MSLLEHINSPADVKALSVPELNNLSEEIRTLLINTIAHTGGHLGPNLGVVELTLALHKVFDLPKDKIVWDVGHQAYIHKIITGRRERFATLRQYKGLSGFPKRMESDCDCFGTGHSSTSISAALGMAIARDLKHEDNNVLAVIGDGALTGGMAIEALNNAGVLQKKLIIVLNDNEMSISKNVGALSEYLYQLRTGETYSHIKKDAETLLKSIPTIGEHVMRTANRVKDSLKYLLVPGMFFEELGFTYIGPVDGHNIESMLEIFEKTKELDKPVIVHVVTKKGKGYAPAMERPNEFHGTGPFDIATGQKISNPHAPITYTKAFGSALVQIAEHNPKVVAITAAMPDGTGLTPFAHAFPERFFDVAIAEQHAVTAAAGMACEGIKPFVAIYSTFLQRAYDQVLHDVCMQDLPVVLCLDRAGLVGDDGYTHHGVFDYSYLRMMPGMTIMAPKDENELRHMVYTASVYEHPIAVRYPRGSAVGVPLEQELKALPIGKAEKLREGKDLYLWAAGSMVQPALAVADSLAEQGIEAGVINARFVKPLDLEMLKATCATGFIVTMEENALAGGFGSGILEALEQNELLQSTKVLSFGIPDEYIQQGAKELLMADLGLDVASMTQKIAAQYQQAKNRE